MKILGNNALTYFKVVKKLLLLFFYDGREEGNYILNMSRKEESRW